MNNSTTKSSPGAGYTGGYVHGPTGRIFTTKAELDIATKAWNKREVLRTYNDVERKRKLIINEQYRQRDLYVAKQVERHKKKGEIASEISKIVEKKVEWAKKRGEYISSNTKHLRQTIDDYKTQIEKLKQAASICEKSLRHHRRDAMKEYESKHPFKHEKALKNLRNKLYKC